MSERPVPPSAEVLAEEIEVAIAKNGVPRCDLLSDYARSIADELAKVMQVAYSGICRVCGEDPADCDCP